MTVALYSAVNHGADSVNITGIYNHTQVYARQAGRTLATFRSYSCVIGLGCGSIHAVLEFIHVIP